MDKSLSTNLSFEDKMTKKIKESIGDLIDLDQLKPLVEKGIQDAFFKERVTEHNYGRKTVEPCLMHSLVVKFAKDEVTKITEDWLKANPNIIAEIFEEVIRDGLGTIMFKVMNEKFRSDLFNFSSQLQESLRQQGAMN